MSQLRKIYSKLKDFLSFDIIGNLPDELVEKILQHLDAKSLCSAAQCSRRWNVLSNKDSLWSVQHDKVDWHACFRST